MPKIKCKLICHANSRHMQQIYTGFLLLRNMGLIDLEQVLVKKQTTDASKETHLRHHKGTQLRVILNDHIRLNYDVHDSYEIEEEYLAKTDYYFKRSYSPQHLHGIGESAKKVLPLGLNYWVNPTNFDLFGAKRGLILGPGAARIEWLRSLGIIRKYYFYPDVRNMWSPPNYEAPPKILFMARAWDPYDKPERAEEKVKDLIQINEVRAACMRMLRDEFGENFYGGFAHTDFACKNYEDLLVPDNALTSKGQYMHLLNSYPICIATTGLNGSIGWKFAEYIAFSKAIISERLNYEVPGDLTKDRNYLEFDSAADCVENARKLFTDTELRKFIMDNNSKYYHSYVRPDALVLNTILMALSEQL